MNIKINNNIRHCERSEAIPNTYWRLLRRTNTLLAMTNEVAL